jgi:hypothetical protein
MDVAKLVPVGLAVGSIALSTYVFPWASSAALLILALAAAVLVVSLAYRYVANARQLPEQDAKALAKQAEKVKLNG